MAMINSKYEGPSLVKRKKQGIDDARKVLKCVFREKPAAPAEVSSEVSSSASATAVQKIWGSNCCNRCEEVAAAKAEVADGPVAASKRKVPHHGTHTLVPACEA